MKKVLALTKLSDARLENVSVGKLDKSFAVAILAAFFVWLIGVAMKYEVNQAETPGRKETLDELSDLFLGACPGITYVFWLGHN